MRLVSILLFSAATLLAQGGGGVPFRDWTPPAPVTAPAVACSELRALTNIDISVISATLIAPTADVPEHCRVRIMIQPEMNIEVDLPSKWNNRLYMFGNGGWAGESFDSAGRVANRAHGLRAGFVTAATDTGHSAVTEPGASFALNKQKLLDYGFRSLHVTAETAKLLVRTYYGSGPAKSYYDGCSQGGREGLTFAQRFPNDFDGIIAGSPGLYQTGTHLARAYWMQGMNANPFPAAKLALLASKVYEQCDAKDGLKDGLIDDPRRCDFQPTHDLPHCAGTTDTPECFTKDQIHSVERIYADVMANGKRFFPGWPVGAEGAWVGQEINGPNGPGAWTTYGSNFLKYVLLQSGDFKTFDLDKSSTQVEEAHQIIDANDPDLSAFRKHGGKLLMYFGWADPQLNPLMGVEYFQQATQKMGDSTGDFFRLFMVPGMYHCGGGVGFNTFDAATPIVNWVEAGKAPDHIEASRVLAGKVVRTRPLCPYPQVARYKGSGSIDESANFSCTVTP